MMSCKDVEFNSKWICKRCTFENWPKSTKCTICLAPNASNYILKEDESSFFNTDKDEIDFKCNNQIKNNFIEEDLNDLNKKWNCLICTYLNWPKSKKCVQCLSIRNKSSSKNSINCNLSDLEDKKNVKNLNLSESKIENDLIEKNNNLNNNLNNLNDIDSNKIIKEVKIQNTKFNNEIASTSYIDSPNLSDNLDLINNDFPIEKDNNSGIFSNEIVTGKWNCSSCTYENWPKSNKCILCSTPKLFSTSSLEASVSSNYLNNVSCETVCSGSNIKNFEEKNNTTSSAITISQRNRTTNSLINNNINSLINYNNRRKTREHVDWYWLEACVGILNGDPEPVIIYLNNGGDLARQLTPVEVNLLNRPSAFDVGYTLVHLAIRFKRNEILKILLENRAPSRAKRVPCSISNISAIEVRKLVNNSLKQRKGEFPCYFVNEFVNFALPQDIVELAPSVQERLFDELLDRDVQKELEEESSIINWSLEITVTLGSRLYALWNRSTGDCLLDSALQATWGVFDKDNRLRKALADSLNDAHHILFPRFKEAETFKVSHQLPYTLDQLQWEEDWAVILSLASQPGSALEQFHIFVLAHILRRPIIVYGVKFVKSFRGETLGYAGFQGIYLPLHWDSSFCSKSPIALGYTRGHFTALVPMQALSDCIMVNCTCAVNENTSINNSCANCCVVTSGSLVKNHIDTDCCYLPLFTSERELLPLHFLVRNELDRQEEIVKKYLDCCVTEGGILVAKQKLSKKPFQMQQMLNEWLDFYRNILVKSCGKKNNVEQCAKTSNTNDTSNLTFSSDSDSD